MSASSHSQIGCPAWAPDGHEIAFVAGDQLDVMNADGADAHHLATGAAGGTCASWSPDGRSLIFAGTSGTGSAIYTITSSGARKRLLYRVQSSSLAFPAWSPNGQLITFLRYSVSGDQGTMGRIDLDVMRWNGEDRHSLVRSVADVAPAWSPDGRSIAFTRAANRVQGIYLLDMKSGQQSRLAGMSAASRHPAWSPDGKTIAFVSNHGGRFGLYVMSADGRNVRRLTG